MNQQILIFRQSGLPIKLEDIDTYDREWKLFYDRAAERAKMNMLLLHRLLRYGERQLKAKFEVEKLVDLPTSLEALNELISSNEDTPIMFAKNASRTQVVAVIMDQLQA